METPLPDLTYLPLAPPRWLAYSCALVAILTLAGFVRAIRRYPFTTKRAVTGGLFLWLLVLGVAARQGFFTILDTAPPRLLPVLTAPTLIIGSLFALPTGRRFVDSLSLPALTYLHALRLPVELVLFCLYVCHQVPVEMTFEGRNFDVLTGVTAPLIAYFTFTRPRLSARWLFVWNVVGLFLLINIVVTALRATPSPVQQLAFQQPNVAVLKFPFVWLPGFVVPIMLMSHIVALQRLRGSFRSSLSETAD